MPITNLKENRLKALFEQILQEDEALFYRLVDEVTKKKQSTQIQETPKERRQRIEKMIDEDFDRFDDVFRALA
jgi:hypothetical protein